MQVQSSIAMPVSGQGGEPATDPESPPLPPAILYAAKSTRDEHDSIPDQLLEAHGWADGQGLEVLAGYFEEDVSAYKGDRGEELANALEHAELAGATLVVQHSDRLARGDAKQARHLVEIALWALKAGVRIHCVQDPSTFENLVMAAVMGERNTEDSRRKALAVKAGLARRRRKGLHNGGSAGYGYRYERDEDDERRRVLDPDTSPVVARMFSLYLEGQGDTAIGRALNDDGITTARGRRWHICSVRAILMNPIYAGLIRDGDELIEGRHEAIVTRESWERAQELRAARARTHRCGRRPAGRHLFRKGFVRCGRSGGSMTPSTTRRPNGATHESYRCCERTADPGACDMPSISRARVDEAVYAYFRDLELDVRATREQLTGAVERTVARARELLDSAEQEERTASERLARVKDDYVAGDLTAAEWRELRGELEPQADAARAEAERLREQLADAQAAVELDDLEAEVLETLSGIRSALAEEVKDADGAAAVRAVLMRLFDGFVLHRGEPEGQGAEPAGTGCWIEPILARHTVDRYDAKLSPVLGRSSLGDNCSSPIGGSKSTARRSVLDNTGGSVEFTTSP
jgi:DNA invertase Pin-like site-specific DNA recombinase